MAKAATPKTPQWNPKRDVPLLVAIATATLAGPSDDPSTWAPDAGYTFAGETETAAIVHLGLAVLNKAVVDPENKTKYAVRATPQGISESGVQPKSPQRMAEIETAEANDQAAIDRVNGESDMLDTTDTVTETEGNVQATGDTAGGEAPKRGRGAPRGPRGPRPPIDLSGIVIGTVAGLPSPVSTGRGVGRQSSYPFGSLAAPIGPKPEAGQPDQRQYSRFFLPATEARPDPAKLLNATVNAHNKKLVERKAVDAATGEVPRFAIFRAPEGDPAGKGAYIYRVA